MDTNVKGEIILEELREELLELINTKGTRDVEVLRISEQLDKLIIEFYNKNSK